MTAKFLVGAAFAAALATAAPAAEAATVRFDFTSVFAPIAPNTGATFAGFVEFDASLVAANAVINVASFCDWQFTWGNDYAWGLGSDFIDSSFDTFQLDATGLGVALADLCFSPSGVCNTGAHPVARVSTTSVAATYDAQGNQSLADGSWGRGTLTVPEPGSFGLVALALAGAAALRRRAV